jgi:hypothetical protein
MLEGINLMVWLKESLAVAEQAPMHGVVMTVTLIQ